MYRTFSTLGCAELDWPDLLALARKHDIDRVELRALSGSTDLPGWLAQHHASPQAWRDQLASDGLSVCGFGTSFRLIDGNASDRDALLAYVPWAEAAGVPWLRVFDGGKTGDAAEIALAAAQLDWWQEQRRTHGWRVDLMIETHDALVTTPRLLALLAAAPCARLLWDTHHTWKKGGEDPVATWRAIHAHTVHLHVKDSVSRPSARHPFTYVLPGDGEFPFAPLLAALRSDHYRHGLSLEWERLWHPYLPPLDHALTAASARNWW